MAGLSARYRPERESGMAQAEQLHLRAPQRMASCRHYPLIVIEFGLAPSDQGFCRQCTCLVKLEVCGQAHIQTTVSGPRRN